MLTINSVMFFLMVYVVKEKMWIPFLKEFSIILYIFVLLILSGICLLLSRFLSHDSIEGGIENIESANDIYLPTYLGYFFIALSIPEKDIFTLFFVFVTLVLFQLYSQNSYYNPLFLIFMYKFYYLSIDGMKIFVISKKNIKNTKDLKFDNLRRINNFTYIDGEKFDESCNC